MVFEVLGHNLLKMIIRSNYQGILMNNVKRITLQVRHHSRVPTGQGNLESQRMLKIVRKVREKMDGNVGYFLISLFSKVYIFLFYGVFMGAD